MNNFLNNFSEDKYKIDNVDNKNSVNDEVGSNKQIQNNLGKEKSFNLEGKAFIPEKIKIDENYNVYLF